MEVAGITITHPDREILPGITKGRLVEYYVNVWEKIKNYLKDRPLTLFRMGDKGLFIQKNIENPPSFLKTVNIDGTNYAIVNNLPSLIYLVNFRTFGFHIPLARWPKIKIPDCIVIDLDPYPPATWEDVVVVSQAIQTLLKKLKLKGFPKLSGKKGLHIFIPSDGGADFSITRELARRLCGLINAALPEITTLEYGKKRGILLDYNQNQWFRSMAAPFTVRENGKVSLPITWDEVEEPPDPTLDEGEERKDPWKGALERQGIALACKKLGIDYKPVSSNSDL